MSIWAALAGGFAGTLVLTTGLRAANALISPASTCPYCSAPLSPATARAKALGYGAHFVNGQIFALLYYAVFTAIGYRSWWLGCVFGLVHGLFAATALVNILLPLIHPRMGTSQTSAPTLPCSNHPDSSCSTTASALPPVTLAAHLAYGTLVGGFLTWPA